jgi:hypothetical protein
MQMKIEGKNGKEQTTPKASGVPLKDCQSWPYKEGEVLQAKGIETIFNKIIAENFLSPEKKVIIKVQEAFRIPDHARKEPPHVIVKMLDIQNKERILKTKRRKCQVTCKGKPIRMTADFSTETLKARGHGMMCFKS